MAAEEPMSSSYADGLSPYDNKGKLGLKETFDSADDVKKKVAQLAKLVREARHVVFHTGAGISTSAGIPDFRGPQGVWTLESKGLKPKVDISFNDAIPTKTHMALVKLLEAGFAQYVISQNIDGLHLRSGIARTKMSELHGNMFTEQCSHCERLYVRINATTSVGEKCLDHPCLSLRPGARPCRGKMHDTILDWEASLPERELSMAEWHSSMADLSITLGTTLQILPSGNLPLQAKKRGGNLVICNLQPTKHDRKGDILIHAYVDDIMEELLHLLGLDMPFYCKEKDPTILAQNSKVEWTISTKVLESTRKLYSQLPKLNVVKRKFSSKAQGKKKAKTEELEPEKKKPLVLSKSEADIDDKQNDLLINNQKCCETSNNREDCTEPANFDLKTEF